MPSNDIFALVAKALAEGKLKEATSLFRENLETLYQENPLLTLKTNFELRFIAGEFEEAYADNEYFQALPYVSQEVEEYLRDLPRLIRANELSAFQRKEKKEEDIMELLSPSTKNEELVLLVSQLGKLDIAPYLPKLIALLGSDVHDDVKGLILMLLVTKGIDTEVSFVKNGERFRLKPKDIGMPFHNEDFDALKGRFATYKDVSVGEFSLEILQQLAMILYPRRPRLQDDLDLTEKAIRELATHYLDNKAPLGEEAKALQTILGKAKPLSE